jgi:hypothetical protein
LPIHPELVAELWCHHWTARPPHLPVMAPSHSSGPATRSSAADQQLSLASMFQNG